MENLKEAAESGNQEAVERLLKEGADVNAQGKWKETPLHWAAGNGHEAIAKYLIERGANVKARDENGEIPLDWALIRDHQTIVKYLVEIYHNSVHCRDHLGRTPLHWASARGYQEVVTYLVEKNADLKARDKKNETALRLAICHKHIAITQLLLAQGAYHYKDLEIEVSLALWMEDWKTQDLMDEKKILCGATILLAGVSISDDVLPEHLQKVKAHIYEGVKQWLDPLKLAPEMLLICIPAVLRILPHVMHLAQTYKKIAQPTIDSNYDESALKQCFFIPEDKPVEKDDLSILQGLQEIHTRLPVELILDIRESMVDKEAVKTLMEAHELEPQLMHYLWYSSKLHFTKRTQPLQPNEPVEAGDVWILQRLWNTKLGFILKEIANILNPDEKMIEILKESISPSRP